MRYIYVYTYIIFSFSLSLSPHFIPLSCLIPISLSPSQVMETRLAHADQDVIQLRAATTELSTEKELLTTMSEDTAQKIRGFVRDIDGLLSDSLSRSHSATGKKTEKE